MSLVATAVPASFRVNLTLNPTVAGEVYMFSRGTLDMFAITATGTTINAYDTLPVLNTNLVYTATRVQPSGGSTYTSAPVRIDHQGSILTAGTRNPTNPASTSLEIIPKAPVVREEETFHQVHHVPGSISPVVFYDYVDLPEYRSWEVLVTTVEVADQLTNLLRSRGPVAFRTCFQDYWVGVVRRIVRTPTAALWSRQERVFRVDMTQINQAGWYTDRPLW